MSIPINSKLILRNKMKKFAPFVGLILVLCANSRAAGPSIDILTVPGIIINSYFADFNNDHKDEAIIFFLDESGSQPTRKVALFTIANGHFKDQPDQVFAIDPTIVCFDVGDFNGDGLRELAFITNKGVTLYQYKKGSLILDSELIIKQPSMFNISSAEDIVFWDFVKDSDSQHKDALIFLPTEPGFNIYRWDGKKYDFAQSLTYAHRLITRGRPAYENYHPQRFQFYCDMPAITLADYNGDKLPDIFVTDNRLVNIYKRNFDGSYTQEPVEVFGKNIQSEQEKHSEYATLKYDIDDLNKDGIADIIVTKNGGDMTQINNSIQIFRGKQMGGYALKPNNEFVSTNGILNLYICDLNRDGRKDLLLASMNQGIMSNLRRLILKDIEINLKCYIQQGTDDYPQKPNFEKSMTYEVNYKQTEYDASMLLADGDYDGDGYCDLLYHDGDGDIKIFRGSITKIFENSPMLEFKIPRPDGISAMDLVSDGRSEIIAHYTVDHNNRKSLRVIWPHL